jgi:hypothetical protein
MLMGLWEYALYLKMVSWFGAGIEECFWCLVSLSEYLRILRFGSVVHEVIFESVNESINIRLKKPKMLLICYPKTEKLYTICGL